VYQTLTEQLKSAESLEEKPRTIRAGQWEWSWFTFRRSAWLQIGKPFVGRRNSTVCDRRL